MLAIVRRARSLSGAPWARVIVPRRPDITSDRKRWIGPFVAKRKEFPFVDSLIGIQQRNFCGWPSQQGPPGDVVRPALANMTRRLPMTATLMSALLASHRASFYV